MATIDNLTPEEFEPLDDRYRRDYERLIEYRQPPATISAHVAQWNRDRMLAGLPALTLDGNGDGFSRSDRDEMLRRLAASRES